VIRGHPLRTIRLARVLLCITIVAVSSALPAHDPRTDDAVAYASTPQAGFQDIIVFSGLVQPTAVRFAPDGRIFVAEKRGIIKVFDNLTDTSPSVFADLRTSVHASWDRGLNSIALDPQFPGVPYLYALYSYDAPIGGVAPTWGIPNADSDGCPATDGCPASVRLSRFPAGGGSAGAEQVLINDWCQQFPNHSIGDLVFGPNRALYVSAGEGGTLRFADYGQSGQPLNPCGDPNTPVGQATTLPGAEGGALRTQDLRTAGDPTTLAGTVIRVNPDTGQALADNPLASSSDPNARRIVAHGFRNPFRMAVRPGTSELWIGDVGWDAWEEINRVPNPTMQVHNFGWPCYEGQGRQSAYDALNLDICESLYNQPGAVTPPYFVYSHSSRVVPTDTCSMGSSSTTGLAFYPSAGPFPAQYNGALFFSDYARNCIWVMFPGANQLPDPSTTRVFVDQASSPVDLQISPQGDLFYVDIQGGKVHRVTYSDSLQPLPPPWKNTDVGNVGITGNASVADDVSTLQGSGSDLWGAVDEFHYVYQPLVGDGTIVARVAWVNPTSSWAKAGVMIRESLLPGSPNAVVGLAYGKGVFFQRRKTTGGITSASYGQGGNNPYWVKLVRAGNTFTVSQSPDGVTWKQIGTDTITMAPNLYVGLALTSHNNAVLNTATFSNVTVTTPTSNTPPAVTISSPSSSATWKVGDVVSFSGSAVDQQDGPLAADRLSWSLIIQHCPSNCHTHLAQTFDGVSSGSFTAPDHDYPSHLELRLTATDLQGMQVSQSLMLQPQTATLTFESLPVSGLQLVAGSTGSTTPFNRTVILGSDNSISAPSPQLKDGISYEFVSWSDGGAASHNVIAHESATYTATYQGAAATVTPTTSPTPTRTASPSPSPTTTLAGSPTQTPAVSATPTLSPTPSATPPPPGANLLLNGDFEAGGANWTIPPWAAGVLSVSEATPTIGSRSLRSTGRAQGPSAQQDVPILPGRPVTLSGQVNIPAATSVNLSIELQPLTGSGGNSGSALPIASFRAVTSGWASFSKTVNVPTSAAKVRVLIRYLNVNGTSHVDELMLTQS
jgi:glucose/arabinose dehydrogenase